MNAVSFLRQHLPIHGNISSLTPHSSSGDFFVVSLFIFVHLILLSIKPDCSFIEHKPFKDNIYTWKILSGEQKNFDFIEVIFNPLARLSHF